MASEICCGKRFSSQVNANNTNHNLPYLSTIKPRLHTSIASHGESFTIPFYAPDNDDAVVVETQPKPESPATIPPPDEIEVVPREKYQESSINGELESWHELIDLLEDRGLRCNQSLPEFPEDMVSLD